MEIEYSTHFEDSYKKLTHAIQKKAEDSEQVFRKDPFDPRLKTHKLHGKLREFYSFPIDYRFRIVFKFVIRRTKAIFLDVGDHDIYF